jgi:hypothetical protein
LTGSGIALRSGAYDLLTAWIGETICTLQMLARLGATVL